MEDPHHRRQTLLFIQRALRHGWDIPERMKQTAPTEVLRLIEEPGVDPRSRLRAIEVLLAMDDSNTTKLLALAKEVRLDSPESPTERHEVVVKVRYVDRMAQVQPANEVAQEPPISPALPAVTECAAECAAETQG